DIAHGLARVARWNGQTEGAHIFSVAQHTLLVDTVARARWPSLDRKARLAVLLHDAPEYVIGDMISPFKAVIGGAYKLVEARLLPREVARHRHRDRREPHRHLAAADRPRATARGDRRDQPSDSWDGRHQHADGRLHPSGRGARPRPDHLRAALGPPRADCHALLCRHQPLD